MVLDWLGKIIVTVGIDKIVGLLKDWWEKHQAKKEINKKVTAVTNAKTIEEQEKAHEDLIIHTRPKR